MLKQAFFKAILDGIIQALVLLCLTRGVLSVAVEGVSLNQKLLISVFGAIMMTVLYYLIIKKLSNKPIVLFSLSSILCFAMCLIIMLSIWITFSSYVNIVSREFNNADGITIIFTTGSFVLSNIFLRTIVFVVVFIRNVCKNKSN